MIIQPLPENSGELAPRDLTLLEQRRIRTAQESSTSANTRWVLDSCAGSFCGLPKSESYQVANSHGTADVELRTSAA